MSDATPDNMKSLSHETRQFPPTAEIQASAHISSYEQYQDIHAASLADPDKFWGETAADLHWFKKWDRVLEWDLPDAKWFVNGKTNLCYNCVDRQVDQGLGDKTAIIWEGEPMQNGKPEVIKLTYADLQRETSKFANVLKAQGVKKGDIVTIYMPMIPELAIAMLACTRIGAPHSIIFGGFSSNSIRDRVNDAKSKIIITADGGWRREKIIKLKETVDTALTETDYVQKVIVVKRCENDIDMKDGRDVWYHDEMAKASDNCPCAELDSEDLAFLLYTSGTTGKPKGIMHTTGGYMTYTYLTSKYVFDLQKDDPNEVYWCTADIGWITGHSYIIYGILPNQVPTLMFEGAPNSPDSNRFWDIVERHGVTKFYTAPTAVRAFMKWGDQHVQKHDVSSIKILGSVGEPINPEAWMWYRDKIGSGKAPIVDTWWQTETGGHMLTPLPGATTCVPGSCTKPFFGIDAAIVTVDGHEVGENQGGLLVIRKPWPSMMRGIYGDRQRFIDTYWSDVKGMYLAGDSARKDENGNFWIMGRIDDVINVSGHRLGTAEVESALVSHDSVAEAAVVGIPHEIKGTGIAAFVTLLDGIEPTEQLKAELRTHVGNDIGAIAKPDQLKFASSLPKTRSGKIMRRVLREIAEGKEVTGDTTTLEDFSIIAELSK